MRETILQEARARFEERAWKRAYELFTDADRDSPLAGGDLELRAFVSYLTSRTGECLTSLERAFQSHQDAGEPRRAARSAFWLGLFLLLRGDLAQANAWLSRAERLIEGVECVEQGYLLLPAAEGHLARDRAEPAFQLASRAVTIGERYHDPDLSAIARHIQGRALVARGELEPGLRLLDDVMLAASREELSPFVTGLMYCSVIEACQQVFAWNRSREWTALLSRWCEQQPELVAFTRTCRVYRAEVLQVEGSWGEALVEASRASARQDPDQAQPPAAAWYRQGEIHRLRGQFEVAEANYRRASLGGFDPQPGLALLRLAQGRTDAAAAAIRRVLGGAADPWYRARLLFPAIEIALASGHREEAHHASCELEELAARFQSDPIQAMASHGRGMVELALARAEAAIPALRRAQALWAELHAPYETARVRESVGLACRELGDHDSANLEFEAANALFESLGAITDLARVAELRAGTGRSRDHPLSRRELQVLRQVAAGKTNKTIAAELSLSERTVDRHVSNILVKLGVPSRAAAAARASQLHLL